VIEIENAIFSSGKDVFENYLTQERCLAQLHFLWACEGLKLTGKNKISSCISKLSMP